VNVLVCGLLLLGIGLVLIEVVVPGGIVGGIGALCMLGGTVAAFYEYGATGGAIALGGSLAALGLGLYLELRWLPRSRLGQKLFLKAEITGRATSAAGEAGLTNRQGQAVTALAPSGLVAVDGRRFEAYSRSGFLEAGTPIVVKGRDNFRLIVEKS
jgi:membrane-bound serine protease (ClpP class)